MPPTSDSSATVEWRRIPDGKVSPPIVRRLPYLELKLEHPGLEPTGYAEQFFPDAVPYELDGCNRVFYWRPALTESSAQPADWEAACATTHGLLGVDMFPHSSPELTTEGESGFTVVVGGTEAGDATTACLASYAPPAVTLEELSGSRTRLTVDGTTHAVSMGERRRISLEERHVEPVEADAGMTTVVPELVVRYPGRREIHHPARGSSYRLFPSFGLDLDEIPNPLPVSTSAGELDADALATRLGVDLSERPYPERVLWQAFGYTAFDPHNDETPELIRRGTDHVVLRTG